MAIVELLLKKITGQCRKAEETADNVKMKSQLRLTSPFLSPLQADFRDSKLQCCPGQSSPLIPAATLRPLTEAVSTVQTVYTIRKPVSPATRCVRSAGAHR